MAYTKEEKLEWIEYFQKKRKELYDSEPDLQHVNLDLLDKRSNIAKQKCDDYVDTEAGLREWQKHGDGFWGEVPQNSVRAIQQACVKQLNILGKSYHPNDLLETLKTKEQYVRINKLWSDTFDGFHEEQLKHPYFPSEDKPESPKPGSPMAISPNRTPVPGSPK
jgi:hypothetical protein